MKDAVTAENRFALCNIAGKRARQLVDGLEKLTLCNSKNEVKIAICEINDNKISFVKMK